MSSRLMLTPSADHPITIKPNPARVVVRIAGQVIADTREALTLREARYPPVQYIPREHVDMAHLARSDHASYCPYKGEAGYFDLTALGDAGVHAVWTYETPYPAVAEIAGYLAFYPDRVTISEVAE
jgi:uncharacterized protein (DUF427 family)